MPEVQTEDQDQDFPTVDFGGKQRILVTPPSDDQVLTRAPRVPNYGEFSSRLGKVLTDPIEEPARKILNLVSQFGSSTPPELGSLFDPMFEMGMALPVGGGAAKGALKPALKFVESAVPKLHAQDLSAAKAFLQGYKSPGVPELSDAEAVMRAHNAGWKPSYSPDWDPGQHSINMIIEDIEKILGGGAVPPSKVTLPPVTKPQPVSSRPSADPETFLKHAFGFVPAGEPEAWAKAYGWKPPFKAEEPSFSILADQFEEGEAKAWMKENHPDIVGDFEKLEKSPSFSGWPAIAGAYKEWSTPAKSALELEGEAAKDWLAGQGHTQVNGVPLEKISPEKAVSYAFHLGMPSAPKGGVSLGKAPPPSTFQGVPVKWNEPLSTEPLPTFAPGEGWKKVGPQLGGGAPGGTYVDSIGVRYYIKTPRSEEAARNEVLANKLYKLAGADVPDVHLTVLNGKPAVVSKILELKTLGEHGADEPWVLDEARKHFGADAWLGHRDAVGPKQDNMLVDPAARKVWRIDQGGAMSYTGFGERKKFGKEVEEFDSMRDPERKAAKIFEPMTEEQINESVHRVTDINPRDISELVKKYGPTDSYEREMLERTLLERQKDLSLKSRFETLPEAQRQAQRVAGGFTQKVYRGTMREPRLVPEYREGAEFYGSTTRDLAEMYGGGHVLSEYWVNPSNFHEHDARGQGWVVAQNEAFPEAKAQGKTGVIIRNVYDEPSSPGSSASAAAAASQLGGPRDVVVVFPKGEAALRLEAAHFDPKRWNMKNLLASGAAVALPAGALFATREAQAHELSTRFGLKPGAQYSVDPATGQTKYHVKDSQGQTRELVPVDYDPWAEKK